MHDLVVVEVLARNRGELGADLHVLAGLLVEELLVLAAVDGVEQTLRQVGARSEELHLLAGLGCGDAAADAVVVTPDGTHHVVVLVLDGGGVDGDLRGVAAEVEGKALAVEHGEVGLRRGTHVLERVQEAVVVLRDHVAAVLAEAGHLERRPDGVAGEELVVAGDARELDHAELQDHVVDELLGLGLRQGSRSEVALDVDVQEGRDAADGHGGAVLGLDGGEVAEVQPLERLVGVGRGLRDVEAVDGGHVLDAPEGADLLGDLLAQADDVVGHGAVAAVEEVLLLLGDKEVDAVQGDAAVVADDAAAAVGVGQAGHDVGVAGGAHLGGVRVEHGLVVGLVVLVEDLVVLRVDLVAVALGGLLRHLDAAVRHERALEGLVGLKAHDLLEVLELGVDVARAICGEAAHDLGLAVEDAAVRALLLLKLLDLAPEPVRGLGRAGEEGLVPVVGRVVALDEVADVDVGRPVACGKSVPLFPKLHRAPLFLAAAPPSWLLVALLRAAQVVRGVSRRGRLPPRGCALRSARARSLAARRRPGCTGCRAPSTCRRRGCGRGGPRRAPRSKGCL